MAPLPNATIATLSPSIYPVIYPTKLLVNSKSLLLSNCIVTQQIMSSFSSSCSWSNNSSGSLFPLNSSIKPISDDKLNAFHNIDRQLFSCLIFSHGREAGESIQVMAFWLWLEKEGYCPMKLVHKILHELPAQLVSQVANETVLCLRCIENDHFIFSGMTEVDDQHISLLQSLMEEKRLSLRQLHENRIAVLTKVTTIVNEICSRAFKDILQPLFGASEAGSSSSTSNRYASTTFLMPPPVIGIPYYHNVNVGGGLPNQLVRFSGVPQFLANDGGGHELTNAIEVPSHQMVEVPNQMMVVRPQGVNSDFNPYEILRLQQQQLQIHEVVNRELGERMGHVRISEHHEAEIQQVPADDRTIFLTFSKGYPISENEVREFFTRKFGDFIEAIHMQEVPPDEQSLFARIVASTEAVIERIAPRNSKAKFSINGKHVWARKYVKKTPRVSTQPTDAGPSQSPGPAAHP